MLISTYKLALKSTIFFGQIYLGHNFLEFFERYFWISYLSYRLGNGNSVDEIFHICQAIPKDAGRLMKALRNRWNFDSRDISISRGGREIIFLFLVSIVILCEDASNIK